MSKKLRLLKSLNTLELYFRHRVPLFRQKATEAMYGILEKGDQSFSDGAINFSLFLVENIHENENCFLFCSL